jgi:hypothetical protein
MVAAMNKDGIYSQRTPPFCQYEAEIFSQLSLIVIPNSFFVAKFLMLENSQRKIFFIWVRIFWKDIKIGKALTYKFGYPSCRCHPL